MYYTPEQRKCQPPNYVGIGRNRGIRVAGSDALEYALEACGIRAVTRTALTDEAEAMLMEWFYSGDWVKKKTIEPADDGKEN